MPAAARVRTGPAEMALTRTPVGPEVGGEIPDGRLERRLGDAHDVVVRDDLLGAVVGERQHGRAGVEEGPRLADERDERVRGDVHREREAVPRRVDERAVEVLALREREGVDEDVDLAVRSPATSP